MAKYGIVETSDLHATHAGHIYSVVDEANIMENGMVVKKGDLVEGELEIYAAEAPAAGDEVILVANPALIYDSKLAKDEANYFIEEGMPARAYQLIPTDRYCVSDYMITALAEEVVVGNYVTASADRKYTEVESLAGTEGFAARIRAIKVLTNEKRVLLEVVKNAAV